MKNIYSSLLLAAAVCSSAMAGDFTAAPSAINHSQVLPMAKNMLTPGRVAGFAAASARKAVQEDPEPEVINYLDGVYTAAQNF